MQLCYGAATAVVAVVGGHCLLTIGKTNKTNISFILIGEPKYHLCRFLAEHFSNVRHAFLSEMSFLSRIMTVSHIL